MSLRRAATVTAGVIAGVGIATEALSQSGDIRVITTDRVNKPPSHNEHVLLRHVSGLVGRIVIKYSEWESGVREDTGQASP